MHARGMKSRVYPRGIYTYIHAYVHIRVYTYYTLLIHTYICIACGLISKPQITVLWQWFVKATGVGGTEGDNHVILKFQADLFYHRGLYQEASSRYSQVLEVLPPSNTVVRREVADSLARCSLQQGDPDLAVECARRLVSGVWWFCV